MEHDCKAEQVEAEVSIGKKATHGKSGLPAVAGALDTLPPSDCSQKSQVSAEADTTQTRRSTVSKKSSSSGAQKGEKFQYVCCSGRRNKSPTY